MRLITAYLLTYLALAISSKLSYSFGINDTFKCSDSVFKHSISEEDVPKDYESSNALRCGEFVEKNSARRIFRQNNGHHRIVNGTAAYAGQFPWYAQLYFGRVSCGGVIIEKRWILTAGHCLRKIDWPRYNFKPYVVIGDYSRKTNDGERIINIKRSIVHPEYFPRKNQQNDIALVELEKPVKFDLHENQGGLGAVNRVCMPGKRIVYPRGFDLIAAGWGEYEMENETPPDTLNFFEPIIASHFGCQSFFKQPINKESQICTRTYFKTTWLGDSGSGVVSIVSDDTKINRYQLVGIISYRSTSFGEINKYNVFTNVAYFWEWIRDTITGRVPMNFD